MLKIEQNLTNTNRVVGINKPKYIVIHDVGALGQAHANAKYFKSVDRSASAHYFVDDNHIVQVVRDNDAAFHVGDGHASGTYAQKNLKGKYGVSNMNSIGIEMCLNPNYKSLYDSHITRKTKNHTIDLVRYLQAKYNIPDKNVIRHYDASRKSCPGRMSANNWKEWKEFYNEIVSNKQSAKPSNNASGGTYTVKKGDSLWLIAKTTGTSVNDLKSINGLKTDVIQIGQVLKLKKTSTKPTTSTITYKVKKGDTLWDIAVAYDMTVSELKNLNSLKSDVLQIGQTLKVKKSNTISTYKVKSGDTLWDIAVAYRMTVKELKTLNGLKSDIIQIEQVLKVKKK